MAWFKRGRHRRGAAAVRPPVPEARLDLPPAVAAPLEPWAAPRPDDVVGSIAALIASGEAWAEPPVTTAPSRPAVHVPQQVAPATVPPPEPVVPVGRVSLGFRDGSTTRLDPDSEQAAALEELALLLSLRD